MQVKSRYQTRLDAVGEMLAPGNMVRSSDIAARIGVSERTAYRYVDALRDQGYRILGEAGVGYRMVEKQKPAGPLKPLTQLEIYETLAASYERSALSLATQAEAASARGSLGTMQSLSTASFIAGAMRAAALDVVEKLKGQG